MQGRRILENSLPEVHFDNNDLIHINWKGYWFTVVNYEHGRQIIISNLGFYSLFTMPEEITVRETGCLKPLDRPIADLGLYFQPIYCRSISFNIECCVRVTIDPHSS